MVLNAPIDAKFSQSAHRHSFMLQNLDVATSQDDSLQTILDATGQLSLTWMDEIRADGTSIPPGRCNLYTYPFVTTLAGRETFVPESLTPLKRVVLASLADPQCSYFEVADEVGAYFIHCLLVANTPEALELAWELLKAKPSLLCVVHTDHRKGFALFTGESCLHIVAANRREKLLLRLVDLAEAELPASAFGELLRTQARGSFFNEMPMRFYGGTALAYSCVFSLRDAVRRYLQTGLVSLNKPEDACVLTGFLPVHAVAANNLTSMYEYITRTLPAEQRADPLACTSIGRFEAKLRSQVRAPAFRCPSTAFRCPSAVALEQLLSSCFIASRRISSYLACSRLFPSLQSLTTMQLAAQLGRHRMFIHILRKQAAILWKWGPVTQFTIDLKGIDSSGSGSADVMQLIARQHALRSTQEMLLDSFMMGFLHKLYVQKWRKFGWKIHYSRHVVDVVLLVRALPELEPNSNRALP